VNVLEQVQRVRRAAVERPHTAPAGRSGAVCPDGPAAAPARPAVGAAAPRAARAQQFRSGYSSRGEQLEAL
jgi:hypothetical protein